MLKLFRLLRADRGPVAFIVLLAFAQSLGNLYLPRLMANIVDDGIVKGDTRIILVTGSVMLVVAVIAMSAAVAGGFLASKTAIRFGRLVRERIFERASHLSVHQFERFGTA